MQGDAEQRSRGSDTIAGCRLGEVFKRGLGARIVLDLVEYEDRALRVDRAPGLDAQAEQEAIDVEIRGKQPRLPDLPGPIQDEGLAMWKSFPGDQIGERGSFPILTLCTKNNPHPPRSIDWLSWAGVLKYGKIGRFDKYTPMTYIASCVS